MDGYDRADQVRLMRESLLRLTGRDLAEGLDLSYGLDAAVASAPYALVAHDTADDPVFVYGNSTALALFELPWDDFTRLPSRLSAEPVEQGEREELLRRVGERGYIDDYQGIRISSTGRRFIIQGATVWDLHDEQGVRRGQAALFEHWLRLDGGETGPSADSHHTPGWSERHDLGWTGGDSPIGDALAATVAAAAALPHHDLGHGHVDPVIAEPAWTHAFDHAEPAAGEHAHHAAAGGLDSPAASAVAVLDSASTAVDAEPETVVDVTVLDDRVDLHSAGTAGAPVRERVRTILTLGARGATAELSVRYDVDAPPELRPLERDELDVVLGWAADAGWEPGLHDADAIWAADADGLWGIEVDGVLVGSGSAMRQGSAYSSLGLLLVDPGHRHRGIGSLAFPFLVDLALERLDDAASVGLSAPEWAQDFYERFGFRRSRRIARTAGTGAVRRRGPYTGQLRALRQLPFDKVVAYDAEHAGGERSSLLRSWITPVGGQALGAYEAGQLIGMAVARPVRDGVRIGPFHADLPEVAEDLMVALAGAHVGGRMVLDVPLDNPDAVALAARHGFVEIGSAVRMVLGDDPSDPPLRTYGETALELA